MQDQGGGSGIRDRRWSLALWGATVGATGAVLRDRTWNHAATGGPLGPGLSGYCQRVATVTVS